ncbi:hypothetical protein FPCIR_4189 [Fusarium pseudocircinatum]|uniref:Uncharacterized protein n=1 Tax=Fusarium pseudocircinatum TaxID=56676 RepID=A0A8H5URV6_9HYPO|nr:hypothetical protein FPCIR_4189 [Fusarium pseudocircinatum]
MRPPASARWRDTVQRTAIAKAGILTIVLLVARLAMNLKIEGQISATKTWSIPHVTKLPQGLDLNGALPGCTKWATGLVGSVHGVHGIRSGPRPINAIRSPIQAPGHPRPSIPAFVVNLTVLPKVSNHLPIKEA